MRERMQHFVTQRSLKQAAQFKPRDTDVFIATYPKCGTTWLQQIVHGLRSHGDMNFDEITRVVPWLELAHDLGLDIYAEQAGDIRAYKSHMSYDDTPKGGRYISIIRDPKEVLVSFYRFFDGWLFEAGSVSLDAFAKEFFMQREDGKRYWSFIKSFWRQRDRDDVLLLCYEDMKQDLQSAIKTIASFCEIDLNQGLLEIVSRQSGLEFMLSQKEKFDDHLVRDARNNALGLPHGGDTTKVQSKNSAEQENKLSEEIINMLGEIWQQEITPKTGFADYHEMRAVF